MTYRGWTFLAICVLALFLTGCAPADGIKPSDVKELLKDGAFLVDVRSKDEFESGHLDGALNIPHTEIKDNLDLFPEDKAKPIVVYCKSGRRSGIAKEELEKQGFTEVVNGGAYSDLKSDS